MKRGFSLVIALGVIFCLTVANAGAIPAPKEVIADPAGDANGLNDQGTGDGSNGDHVTPADASTVTDILSIGLSNDAKNLYISVGTEAAAPGTQGVGYRVRFNPDGAGGTHCLVFEAFYPGAGNALDTAEAIMRDTCAGGEVVPVELLGNMIVVPRKLHKGLSKGAVLKAPQAQSFVYLGASYPAGAAIHTDTTKIGKDYKLVK